MSYHKLKKSTYDSIRDRTFNRMNGKPMWRNKKDLLQERSEVWLVWIDLNTHYGWGADYGMLAMIIGGDRYLADTNLNYVEPVQPHNVHPTVIVGAIPAQICTWNMNNDLERRDWLVGKSFKRAVDKNVRDTLDLQYYEQIKQLTSVFKKCLFRDYIVHLKSHWCRLDVKTIESLKQHWSGYGGRTDTSQGSPSA